jgi:hypothetical protein
MVAVMVVRRWYQCTAPHCPLPCLRSLLNRQRHLVLLPVLVLLLVVVTMLLQHVQRGRRRRTLLSMLTPFARSLLS